MPAEGIFHNLMIVAIRKSYPGHARKIMNAIWSLGQAMFTKLIVVVDHDVNIHDYREVAWKALCALDPERDVQFSLGPVDTLDHAQRMLIAFRDAAVEGAPVAQPDADQRRLEHVVRLLSREPALHFRSDGAGARQDRRNGRRPSHALGNEPPPRPLAIAVVRRLEIDLARHV